MLRPDKTEAIADAAFAELAAAGWAGLNMDRVAARAGVGKAALYRRWPSKDAMLLDLIAQAGAERVPAPDTGRLRNDLVAYVRAVRAALADPTVAAIVSEVLAHTRRSPELAEAIRRRFRDPRRRALRSVLQRAVDRGELPPAADVELGLDLIAGPLVLDAVGLGRRRTAADAEALVDAVLAALTRS